MRWLCLLLCTGCMLPSMNQQGLQLVVNDLQTAKEANVKAAESLKAIVTEINTASEQERPPIIAPLLTDATLSIATIAESVDEAGKTAVTMQSAIGTPSPETVLPATKDQKEMWRARYIALAKVFAKLKAWAQSKLPIPASAKTAAPAPWSGTDIAALITALTAGLGTLGLGTKKVVDTHKKSKALSLEAEMLAERYKTKCNGDNEFEETMRELPTITRDHRERKV